MESKLTLKMAFSKARHFELVKIQMCAGTGGAAAPTAVTGGATVHAVQRSGSEWCDSKTSRRSRVSILNLRKRRGNVNFVETIITCEINAQRNMRNVTIAIKWGYFKSVCRVQKPKFVHEVVKSVMSNDYSDTYFLGVVNSTSPGMRLDMSCHGLN